MDPVIYDRSVLHAASLFADILMTLRHKLHVCKGLKSFAEQPQGQEFGGETMEIGKRLIRHIRHPTTINNHEIFAKISLTSSTRTALPVESGLGKK
ncbi:hypothetical protein AVEN_244061-1 [Araneus ventricosus]|uniref:Uncharacterized protein n=1 Tax=Araneus ventricosus TaxID=182803 RepID=A0A4Y2IHP6_ARAVE|nr:hypothetical protein AVEN_244061-1 [Araneus ventricosus]